MKRGADTLDKYKLLLVDDEVAFIEILKERLTRKGYQVTATSSSEDALELINEPAFDFDVALLDIMMNKIDGMQLLGKIKQLHPNTEVVMLTGYSTVETAIEAMKKGAYDYLTKPTKPVELELVLQKAAEKKKLKDHNTKLIETNLHNHTKQTIIGESNKITELKEIINKIADSTSPVLILGESGTGKELVARALHYGSCRAKQAFVPINASAIPAQLLESELFGHTKGAFTGALAAKKGLIELSEGGTLFLDEIGDMDIALQSKLLRFLDSGEYRPVGSTVTKKSSVRIVAATNLNLENEIANGNFREDLFYRLSVISVVVPPLREREHDVLILAQHILEQKLGYKQNKAFSEEAKKFLVEYHFPGNVRELINLVERGILLSKSQTITKDDLISPHVKTLPKNYSLQEIEKEHIKNVLDETAWDKPAAAKLLNIGLRTLYRKIEEYNLS